MRFSWPFLCVTLLTACPDDAPPLDAAAAVDTPAADAPTDAPDVAVEDDVPNVPDVPAVGDVPPDLGPPDPDAPDVPVAADAADAPDVPYEPDVPDEPEPLWLLSIDNGTHALQVVDVETGAGTDLCTLDNVQFYPSLTYSRSNLLFASRGGTALDTIDPCTCHVEPLGSYGGWSGVNGITSDQAVGLFGVSSGSDELITIVTKSGQAAAVGPLNVNFGTGGATWSDALGGLYAINGSDDSLYTVDPDTGAATLVVKTDKDFGSVGIELHPANDVIYACSTDIVLVSVNPTTGAVTEIGPIGQTQQCTNLAAPYKADPCVSL